MLLDRTELHEQTIEREVESGSCFWIAFDSPHLPRVVFHLTISAYWRHDFHPLMWSNKAPAPGRQPRFPLGEPGEFMYYLCIPPATSAAVGNAQRSAT
jgi:hypothetical protein